MSGEAKDFFIFGVSVKDIVPVVIGAIVGGLIGFGSSLGTSWFNNRTLRKKEEKEKAIGIILDVVKYFLKMNAMADDIKEIMRRFQLQMKRTKDKEEASQVVKEHRGTLLKIREKIPELVAEESFREIQLVLVGDQDILKRFRPLINAFSEYYEADNKDAKIFGEKEAAYSKLYKEFMNLCVETCKALAPVRTPGAPDKKKGLAKNG